LKKRWLAAAAAGGVVLAGLSSAPAFADGYEDGEVIFSETFDYSSFEASPYTLFSNTPDATQQQIEDGVLRVQNSADSSSGSSFYHLWTRPADLHEFTVSVDMTARSLLGANINGYPGLLLNDAAQVPNDSLVAVFMRVKGSSSSGFNRYVNGSYIGTGSSGESASLIDLDRTYRITVEITPDVLVWYVDGVARRQVQNFHDGDAFGVLARGADVEFDNFEVVAGANLGGIYADEWIDPADRVVANDYTLAVIPDTQKMTESYPAALASTVGYIRDNATEENIRFAMHLGDLTEDNSEAQWDRIADAMSELDGTVPYSVIPGNHDYVTTATSDRDLTRYDAAFPRSAYADADTFGASFDQSMANTFHTFTVGSTEYLVLALEMAPRQAVIDWAKDVIESHPSHNVIITTHAYLASDGSRYTREGLASSYPFLAHGNDLSGGVEVWDQLGAAYENVVLMISGHTLWDFVVHRADEGVHGNVVHQIMVNGQSLDSQFGGLGMIMLLRFSDEGRHVEAQYYSAVRQQLFGESNQLSLDLHVVGGDDEPGAGIPVQATVEADGVPGVLVMTVADYGSGVLLQEQINAGDRLRFVGSLPAVTVTDSRADTTCGWRVTGQASSLSASSVVVSADHLGWTPTIVEPRPGVTVGSQQQTVLSGGTGLLTPATLAEAVGAGTGSTALGAEIVLEVPVDQVAGTYRGEVGLTLFPID